MAEIKVQVLEVDGEELVDAQERILIADDVKFTPSNNLSSTNLGDVVAEIKGLIDNSNNFPIFTNYGFSKNDDEITTDSANFIDHVSINYSTTASKHVFKWSIEIHKEHNSGIRYQIDVNGVTRDFYDYNKTLGENYEVVSGFDEIELLSGNNTITLRFSSNKRGKEVGIKNSRLMLWRKL